MAYAQIDWHDFVVVETVVFTEADDSADLPPPTTLSDLQYASLEQKAMNSLQSQTLRIEEAMPSSDDFTAFPGQKWYAEDDKDEDMNESDNEDEETVRARERREALRRQQQAQVEAKGGAGPMKIRSVHVPRAAAAAASRRGVQMGVCPNCQQQIPINEMEEHMRSNIPPSLSPLPLLSFLYHTALKPPHPPLQTIPLTPLCSRTPRPPVERTTRARRGSFLNNQPCSQ